MLPPNELEAIKFLQSLPPGKHLDELLWSLVKAMDLKYTIICEQSVPYLGRFYLGQRSRPNVPSVYLHYFFASDDPDFLHNHPWNDSHSLILTGGYREESFITGARGLPFGKNGPEIEVTTFRPGDWVDISQNRYHRVELLGKGCWTLFIAGKRVDTWHFWERKTNKLEEWSVRNARLGDQTFIIRGTAADSKMLKLREAAVYPG